MDSKLIYIIELINKTLGLTNLFKFNEFTKNIEFSNIPAWSKNKVLTDTDILEIKYCLAKEYGKDFSVMILNEAITLIANQNKYHPVFDYMNSLEWDGVRRLNCWISEICGCPVNEYYRDVGIKILCAACYRIRNPGVKFDYMAILEGDQGIGKSTLLSILGGQWYLDTHFSTKENKQDIIDMMRTALIVEISDLAGFRKNDIESLKAFLSRQVDRVRMPYARRSEDFARQCVFIGTHNPSGNNTYFRDDTGNRRFWPVTCGRIDLNKMKAWRDQLWAEAWEWTSSEGVYLYMEDSKSLEILDGLHKEREQDSPLNSLIDDFVKGKNEVHNKDIIEKAFHVDIGKCDATVLHGKNTFIGIWMRKNGWIKGENKKRGWYFKNDNMFTPTDNKTNWQE